MSSNSSTGMAVATDEEWAAISVPMGWEPVARACRVFSDGLPEFCDRVALEIADSVDDLRAPKVKAPVVVRAVQRLVQPALFGMAENRGPLPHEIEIGWIGGTLHARTGGSPDALPRSFQIAFRAFMEELSSIVDPQGRGLLFESVSTLWMWLHEMSDAAARGFRDESAALAAIDADARERFVAALQRGDASTETVRQFARSLGFDVSRSFRALWLRTTVDASVLRSAVNRIPGVTQLLVHGTDVLIISQGVAVDKLQDALVVSAPSSPLGIGVEREGLEGARISLIEAEWSMELSEVSGKAVRFERDWLMATLLSRRENLALLLEKGVDVSRDHAHFAEAVSAFAENGFSQSGAARALHLQPNSLAYRLRRWRDLTGEDAYTPDGVIYAMLSMLCSREG